MAFDERRVRAQFPILSTKVPSSKGRPNPLRYFDHAASTHAPRPVLEAIEDLASHGYANVHRGNHHLSRVATDAFESARQQLAQFIGAQDAQDSLIFGQNTTSSLELAAFVMSHVRGDVIISHLEHHSNDLPHRRQSRVHRVDPGNDVSSLPQKIEQVLRKTRRVKLVAITGASNVTGECPDVQAIARIAHEYDAKILVDAAQLLAHKPIDVKSPDAPDHIDFLAAAGHKTYAPFGSSFLYGPQDLFDKAAPYLPGGGTVSLVTTGDAQYLKSPDRHEAGTPNVVGAVAFAAATRWLQRIGMQHVYEHEIKLADYMRQKAREVRGLTTYQVGGAPDRLGVMPFTLQGWKHADLAAALDDGWGIATRDGCFCAQPLVADLLGVTDKERYKFNETEEGRKEMPGLVRASLGAYNHRKDVDVLIEALHTLASSATTRTTMTRRVIAT